MLHVPAATAAERPRCVALPSWGHGFVDNFGKHCALFSSLLMLGETLCRIIKLSWLFSLRRVPLLVEMLWDCSSPPLFYQSQQVACFLLCYALEQESKLRRDRFGYRVACCEVE